MLMKRVRLLRGRSNFSGDGRNCSGDGRNCSGDQKNCSGTGQLSAGRVKSPREGSNMLGGRVNRGFQGFGLLTAAPPVECNGNEGLLVEVSNFSPPGGVFISFPSRKRNKTKKNQVKMNPRPGVLTPHTPIQSTSVEN